MGKRVRNRKAGTGSTLDGRRIGAGVSRLRAFAAVVGLGLAVLGGLLWLGGAASSSPDTAVRDNVKGSVSGPVEVEDWSDFQ